MTALYLGLKPGTDKIKQLAAELQKTNKVITIGVSGGSGSGKGHVSKIISSILNGKILCMDDYYLGFANMPGENFDQPNALDLPLLRKHLLYLKKQKTIDKPVYDFSTHKRTGYEKYTPSPVIMLDGIFALNVKTDLGIFIDAPEGVRLKRRIQRDITQRGRTEKSVREYWETRVKPMHEKYVEPQKLQAQLIIDNS